MPLTATDAPALSSEMVARANALARVGEVAIVATVAPWNTYTPYHRERIMPGAFGNIRIAPPLLAEHSGRTRSGGPPHVMGSGVYAENRVEGRTYDDYGVGGGLDCLWMLRDDVDSVHALFGHVAAGLDGVSMEFRVAESRMVRESRDRPLVRIVEEALLTAVALVDVPSYMDARIRAIVTPGASWTPRRGVLMPNVEPEIVGDVFRTEYAEVLDRAAHATPVDALLDSIDPALQARSGRHYGPLELR